MILGLIFFLLTIFLVILFFIPQTEVIVLKKLSIWISGFILILTTFLLITFKLNSFYFQNMTSFNIGSSLFNITFVFGLDGISILFVFLTSLLCLLCLIFIWNEYFFKYFLVNLFLLELLLILVFSTLDILLFYIFFEAILIPMFFLIGIWGSRERKIRAAYLLFFYTLITSLLMLSSLLYIYYKVGSFSFEYITTYPFSFKEQFWLWLAFFFSLASKIPMFPFHIWLPEAHVEAPTIGSVLLAGILLKIGVYGLIRFNISLFIEASIFFSPLVFILALIGIIYASFTALRQTDLKRIIAYSSIAHMNLVVLGLFSFNNLGLEGGLLQSINHGFVSGALFLLIGVVYNRYHSRLLIYYGGLVYTMPIYASIFLYFTLANIALPGTSSFIGEFLLLLGTFKFNIISGFVAALSVIVSGAYSLWLTNRLLFGNLKIKFTNIYKDINIREFMIILPLIIFVLLFGIFPNIILKFIQTSYIYIIYFQ